MAVVLVVTAREASAASLSWNGSASTDWFTAANWSPTQVPTSADDAAIDSNSTVLIAGAVPASFNSLVLGNASGTTAPTLRVTGTLSTSGSLTIQRAAVLSFETTALSTVGQMTIAPGGALTHAANSSSKTSLVNLSVNGDFDLQAGATVTLVGKGYAGGTSSNGSGPGAGRGATGFCDSTGGGAGHGGSGGNAATRNLSPGGPGYDSVLDPSDLGSGGGAAGDPGCGGGPAGGAGGGAVLLTVGNTATLSGLISADGASSGVGAGGGSGGTINVKAGTLSGNGVLRANGGNSGGGGGGGAGGGRIALTASVASSFSGSVSAFAGAGSNNGGPGVWALKVAPAAGYDLVADGGGVIPSTLTVIPSGLSGVANLSVSTVNLTGGSLSLSNDFVLGTRANATFSQLTTGRNIVVPSGAFSGALNGVVTVQNDVIISSSASGSLLGVFTVQNDAVVQDGATLFASSMSVTRDLIIRSGAKLRHPANTSVKQYWLNLTISRNFDIQSGGMVDLVGVGYAGGASSNGNGSGFGAGATGFCDSTGGGAGHGGTGGNAGTRNHSAGGVTYDSAISPTDLGSGGGAAGDPGCSNSFPGGGGGGTLIAAVANTLTLNGLITASGANGGVGAGGGSGGTVNLTAGALIGSGSILASGGTSGGSGGGGGGGGRIALSACGAVLAVVAVAGAVPPGSGSPGGAGSVQKITPGSCPPPPPAPSGLAVTSAGLTSLSVVWSSTVAVISYTLQVSTDPTFASAPISATTSDTSATLTGLQTRTVYYLRVLATNGTGSSSYSPSISATTLIIPSNISWIGGSGSSWFNGANWSPALVPHSVDTVTINANTTVVIASGAAAFSSLVLGNLAGDTTPTLKVSGAIAPSGSLIVNPNATLQQDTTQSLTLGEIIVASGGVISADAGGFAPGTGPGAGVTVPEASGGGSGSGAAYGGNGGAGINGGNIGPDGNIVLGGSAYGYISQPADFGSGGGGITSGANVVVRGGRGGGQIIINAGTLRVNGRVSADGQAGELNTFWNDRAGGGSGGSVQINVQQLEGSGVISANGGASSPREAKNGGGGSGGRIAISYGASTFNGAVAARGGLGRQFGGAGTIVYGSELRIDNGVTGATTPILSGLYSFNGVTIGSHAVVEVAAGASLNAASLLAQGESTVTNRGNLTVSGVVASSGLAVLRQIEGTMSAARLEAATGGLLAYDGGVLTAQEAETSSGGSLSINTRLELARLRVAPGGVVTHDPGDTGFDLAVSQTMTVESGGRVSADGVGFDQSTGPGAGLTVPENFGGGRGSGAGYGGAGGGGNFGGNGSPPTAGGSTYGSLAQPSDLGSGGGGIYTGGNNVVVRGGRGGGRLRIAAGTLRVDGRISADGQPGAENGYWGDRAGGGSGGSVLISAQQLEGTGMITANGGASSPRGQLNGGAGGGGRIALYYTTKVGSQTLVVNGGIGGQNGFSGSILDNGTLYGTVAGSSATLAFSQMQERLAATKTLGDTLSAQLLNFAGATSTGVPTGTFTLAELRVVLVKTGPFTNKGFFRGRYTLSIPAGEALSGEWEGMAFFTADDSKHLFLKGALKGRIVGVFDGSLTESTAGNGVFDRLTAGCSLVQVGDAMGASTIYISGTGSVVETAQYPGTTLNFLQAAQAGEVGGYYSTPADIAFTLLRVNNPGNPYHGEGFFAANYDSPLGSGQGWAYAVASGDSARLAGPFEQSLKGLMEGVLTLNSPRSLLLTLRNLDAGLPLQADITTSLASAGNTPIGGVATVIVELRNDGYAVAEGVTVVGIGPEKSRFVSATGNYRTYNVTHWRDQHYAPKPFIRWDFVTVPARSVQKMTYQVRLPASSPNNVQAGIGVESVTKAWADTIFANYHLGDVP